MLKFLVIAISLLVGSVQAETIEFTVHHAPGGPSDTITRIVNKAADNGFTIVNRPGASGRIAVKHLLAEKTIMLATMTQIYVANPLMFNDLEYNPEKDLELLGVVASMPSVLVCNSSKNINTVQDLSTDRLINFGVAGYGSSEHLATEVLLKKISKKHLIVPYSKGGSAAVNDMVGGTIDCMFANYPTVKGWIGDKRLNFIMSSHNLDIKLPTWNTVFHEDFPFQSYLGLVIANNTDAKLKLQLNKKIATAFAKKEFVEDLKQAGVFPVASNSKKSIESVLYNNTQLRTFILQNNIKLKE